MALPVPLDHHCTTLILLGPLPITTLCKLRSKVDYGRPRGLWGPWSWVVDKEHGGPTFTFCWWRASRVRPTPPRARGALERPPKGPRRRTIQSTTYNYIETEPDAQAPLETVLLSDNCSDEYQNSRRSDQTGSNTVPDTEDNDILDPTWSGLRHRSRTADGQQTIIDWRCEFQQRPGHRWQPLLGRRRHLRGGWCPVERILGQCSSNPV